MSTPSIQRTLQGTPDQPVLVFEREYAADVAELWSACTEPERVQRFFGTFSGEPPQGVGAQFRIDLGGDDDVAVGTVTDCEPMRLIGYDWSWQGEQSSHVQVSFSPTDGGTRLRIVHRMGEPDHAAGYGGGWEQMMAALGAETGTESYDDAAYQQLERTAVGQWRQLLGAAPAERD
ncbi:SRPBCC domain-containing protein [Flexivirga sp. B27]